MARRKQEGNRFFRLDVDFFSDKKVKILKARYGADWGYLISVYPM
ncbi:MAG: Lin1244/Lin1753 domain-containing protein [Lachnospiraceae bacterium]